MSDSTLDVTQSLDALQKLLRIKDNLDGTYSLAASILASALPAGAATSANQLTMISNMNKDFGTEVARGVVAGFSRVNKFGAAPEGIQTTATDIWSRADSAATQQIWLAPTAARVHAIVSSSASDDGDPVGVGARTLRVYGLKTWDLAETSEDITLDGTTPVNTAQSYVIIHRMKVLTSGATGINVGTITATAATDGTITAVILPGDGQTEMAIYGVPSTQTFYLKRWGAAIGKGNTTLSCNFVLRVNENPNVQTTNYLRKDDINLVTTGTSGISRDYEIPPSFPAGCYANRFPKFAHLFLLLASTRRALRKFLSLF